MTPKEKAEALVRSYMRLFPSWVYLDEKWREENNYTKHKHSKKAAAIAVKEVMRDEMYKNSKYWKDVEKELENL